MDLREISSHLSKLIIKLILFEVEAADVTLGVTLVSFQVTTVINSFQIDGNIVTGECEVSDDSQFGISDDECHTSAPHGVGKACFPNLDINAAVGQASVELDDKQISEGGI